MRKFMFNVFITDGRSRATLVMCKFLRQKGLNVTVGESRNICHTFFSRYVNKSILYPPVENEKEFHDFILDFLKKNKIDVLIPIRDISVNFFSKYKSDFQKYTKIPVADHEVIEKCMNKSEVTRIADSSGIPTPKTYTLKSGNILEISIFI